MIFFTDGMQYVPASCVIWLFILLSVQGFTPADASTGTIRGTVIDSETREPVSYVYLSLEEIERTQVSHSDGTFMFSNVPEGTYTLRLQRMGYKKQLLTVDVPANDTLFITPSLHSTVLREGGIEIVGQRVQRSSNHLEKAIQSISGEELRQNLGTTLSGTLEDLPGLSTQSMGTAPARPVMRGLGGERLMILQDGERTGDVSSQSADHAVTVDPMAAEEIEIARGPYALEYGSNAIGGVINVVRNQIPTSNTDHVHGTASVQGESVNSGASAGLEFSAPLGDNFVLKADGNIRSALDTRTPEGALENSGIFSTNDAVGIGYVRPWGHAGLASSLYINHYGIPPDSLGGHPDGVDIEMRKLQFKGSTEVFLERDVLKKLEADVSHKSYFHREIESSGVSGTEFGVLTSNLSLKVNHGEIAFFNAGKVGLWGERKNYVVNGTRTPDSDSYSFSTFLIEEKDVGALHMEVGARLDHTTVMPAVDNAFINGREIRQRSFTALASAANAVYDFGDGFFTGVTFIHSFRAPSQEELFSRGPHLASYSFEVGNPDLDPERGFGKEVYLRYRQSKARAELSVFHNGFTNYNYARNTGTRAPQDPSLYIYQFTGTRAVLSGVELDAQVKLYDKWAFSAALSYTHGKRERFELEENGTDSRWRPLPEIPPLKGHMEVSYTHRKLRLGTRSSMSASQNRTGEFERATDGYAIFKLFSQYRFQKWDLLHTVSLNANNIFDTTYRNHLSRIKEIYPAPGRNIALLYRIYF